MLETQSLPGGRAPPGEFTETELKTQGVGEKSHEIVVLGETAVLDNDEMLEISTRDRVTHKEYRWMKKR